MVCEYPSKLWSHQFLQHIIDIYFHIQRTECAALCVHHGNGGPKHGRHSSKPCSLWVHSLSPLCSQILISGSESSYLRTPADNRTFYFVTSVLSGFSLVSSNQMISHCGFRVHAPRPLILPSQADCWVLELLHLHETAVHCFERTQPSASFLLACIPYHLFIGYIARVNPETNEFVGE